MIRNELKDLLPEGWESMFKHRKDWDPEGYSVAAFRLKETDKREIVLAKFDKTNDIMDYFFDDKPNNYEIGDDIKRVLKFMIGSEVNNTKYRIKKDYMICGGNFGGNFKQFGKSDRRPDRYDSGTVYPKISLNRKIIPIHRLVAFIFVPNPYPDKYSIVNHKDKSKTNFKKENLEWCDEKWNSKRENQKEYSPKKFYIRLSDNKSFSSSELEKEYGIDKKKIVNKIRYSISNKRKCFNSFWMIVNKTLQDYLDLYPLRDDWYPHPYIPNVIANGCGLLKINGELRIGSINISGVSDNYGTYTLVIGGKKYQTHRLLAECYYCRKIENGEVVDHIIPVNGIANNSKENLRICTMSDNMNNRNTLINMGKPLSLYNMFGKLIKRYEIRSELFNDCGTSRLKISPKTYLTYNKEYLLANDEFPVEHKLDYIYYKWKIENGEKICIKAGQDLGPLCDDYDRKTGSHIPTKLRKYLNTGMPAQDGFYYQQGNPKEMIYDPTNTKLEKKYPEIHWKDRDKN